MQLDLFYHHPDQEHPMNTNTGPEELEQIVATTCPTCKGMAQAIIAEGRHEYRTIATSYAPQPDEKPLVELMLYLGRRFPMQCGVASRNAASIVRDFLSDRSTPATAAAPGAADANQVHGDNA